MNIVPDGITLNDAFITIYILTAIAAAQSAILLNLAKRVGGVRKLIKLASSSTKHEANDAKDKNDDA